jgi:hypothetical protein
MRMRTHTGGLKFLIQRFKVVNANASAEGALLGIEFRIRKEL